MSTLIEGQRQPTSAGTCTDQLQPVLVLRVFLLRAREAWHQEAAVFACPGRFV